MILNNTGSTVTTVGDVSEHQISIDERNLEHIISILSTNLYSNPEQSFLREIICNAIDAQVEAHSDEPAIISMSEDAGSGKYVIAIRDYGTGISPERFHDIYLNIGSSTKRESNDFIGSFGIGRFSALACADMVHITSFYEGIQYQYLMLKNGTKINVDLLSETPTEEHNGVEVKITVEDLTKYRDALRYLWFIPNVYVHDSAIPASKYYYQRTSYRISEEFNNRQLCVYNTFAFNNIGEEGPFVMLGNILYPVNIEHLPTELKTRQDTEYVWPYIIPKFNIGELDITPNREQLLYSDRTIKALRERYLEVAKEMVEMLKKQSEKPFDDIFMYYDSTGGNRKHMTLAGVDNMIVLEKDSYFYPYLQYKYRDGQPLADDKQVRHAIYSFRYKTFDTIFQSCMMFEDDNYYTQKQIAHGSSRTRSQGIYSTAFVKNHDGRVPAELRIVFVPSFEGLRSDIFKDYLSHKCAQIKQSNGGKRVVFLFTTDPYSWKTFIKRGRIEVTVTSDSSVQDIHKSVWLLREMIHSMNCRIFKSDIVKSKDYVDYRQTELASRKQERKERDTSKFSSKTRFYLETYDKDDYYLDHHPRKIDVEDVPTLIAQVNWSKSDTTPVYWGEVDNDYVGIWKNLAICHQAFKVITVAKSNIRCLEKASLPSNWIKVTPEFILNSRLFRKWMTKRDKQVLPREHTFDVMKQIQSYDEVRKVSSVCSWGLEGRGPWDSYAKGSIRDKQAFKDLEQQYTGYYDQTMLEGYATINKFNQIAASVESIVQLNHGCVNSLTTYVAMKHRLFRPNWQTYKSIKNVLNPKPIVEQSTNEEDN